MSYTPAIQQYLETKKQYPDCILFFRIGDFYETFFEDAKICSKVLDLILTSKNKDAPNPIPMAGIPYHSVDKYIPKLLHHGYKIAIAEQITDPVPGKIVERKVTQIITPGTYVQESRKDFNFLLALFFGPSLSGDNYHIAWGDFSIGEYWTKSFADLSHLQKFILKLNPSEIIFDINFPDKDVITLPLQHSSTCIASLFDLPPDPAHFICQITKVQTLSSFGKALEDGRLQALALLFHYLVYTQKTYSENNNKNLSNIVRISFHNQDYRVLLDDITLKNLEIFSSTYEKSTKYSLVGILDTTKTSGGSRLLRFVLSNPISDVQQINRRLSHIARFYQNQDYTKYLHANLAHVFDIPKIVTFLLYKKLSPTPFIKLRSTLRLFLEKQEMLDELLQLGLSDQTLTSVQHLFNYLDQLLKDDSEYQEDINFVRDGYHQGIDELRKLAYHSDELILHYQQELVKASGVLNVKIKFVMNQGYFIEITNKDIQQFESKIASFRLQGQDVQKFEIIRRNTLKGGQRYTSPYLDDLQEKILKAKEELARLEFDLLAQAREKISHLVHDLYTFADFISRLDLFSSHALFAREKGYCKPELLDSSLLHIVDGRHPVIEEFLPRDQHFVPNTLEMNINKNGFLHIITGPNMGGKSTYLRQNALIVLMAHCGLFVPAKEAKIGLVDALFARVGSGDIIAKNQSTFMTEMIEVANILNNASNKSFVIFDELGRGTATYDGLALTKAILEYLVSQIKCKTLIATHYHELIELENVFDQVKNFSVTVYETDKEVVFLKKIVRGGANKSYGLDVAKIAGIPKSILERAKEILQELEKFHQKKDGKTLQMESLPLTPPPLFVKADPVYEKIKAMLESYDINTLTPLQALQLLAKIKDELNS